MLDEDPENIKDKIFNESKKEIENLIEENYNKPDSIVIIDRKLEKKLKEQKFETEYFVKK